MARKSPGLQKRGNTWWIDKIVCGQRLRESTGTERILNEAERFLAFRVEQVRQASIYGVAVRKTFKEAATRYLSGKSSNRAIAREARKD